MFYGRKIMRKVTGLWALCSVAFALRGLDSSWTGTTLCLWPCLEGCGPGEAWVGLGQGQSSKAALASAQRQRPCRA